MDKKEKEIINSCRQGNKEAFGQLYDMYIEKIYKFIYFKTHHKETAEDITSKVFFKAFKNMESFKDADGGFAPWIYKIARNAIIDHFRIFKNDINIEDAWGIVSNSSIEIDFDIKEKITEIKKYLAKLDVDQRDIVIMRIWQGMSYKEIADVLGKSEGGCKMMFKRTLDRLKKEMPLSLLIMFLIK